MRDANIGFRNRIGQLNMNTDGVAAAFELIVEEIEGVAQEIADLGGEAFKVKDYQKAQVLGESGKNLQSFRERVSKLLEDWQAGIDVDTRKRFSSKNHEKSKEISAHSKSSKTKLKVTLPNGEIIEEYYAADTFAITIKTLGVDKIRGMGLMDSGIPLIDASKHDQYGQRKINGWYICTHSSTKRKKEILETIAKKLGIRLQIAIK